MTTDVTALAGRQILRDASVWPLAARKLAACALVFLPLCACGPATGAGGGRDEAAGPVAVTTARAAYTRLATPIELSGSLAAVRSVTVGAISAGRVTRVDVRAGDVVEAGDAIAQVDTSIYAAQVSQSQAGAAAASANRAAGSATVVAAGQTVLAARAQRDAAAGRYVLAATTWARMASLYAQGAIARQQRDQSRSELIAARAELTQAETRIAAAAAGVAAARAQSRAAAATVSQAGAAVTAASIALRDTTLVAPFGGVVVSKFVEPGAVVGAGTPVIALENARDLELNVAVPDDAAGTLARGTLLVVHVDALGGATLPARVRAVVPLQNPALRSATVNIAVAPRAGLLPGMFARVSIPGDPHRAVTVPLAALVTRGGQSGVFVVRNGKAAFVPVQTGTVGAKLVEVSGVAAGDDVAIDNLQRLDEGSRIAIARR